ncbi:MAG TPA: DUF1365 domain-containing protein [Alphaproteobacteria bacterium]|jgi:DUF1365 family protein|nr:DUF1365 domain-containing protein [Alphaproteobacteria bacterium]
MNGARIYFGAVMHRRLGRVRHGFRYRVFSCLLDLDEIHALDRASRLFSYNRWNVFSFYDRDHGAGDGSSVKAWIENHLIAAGLEHALGGRIRLLCFPRIWGYVFNPLSVFFCEAPDGRLAAILYEVSNTFGQRHSYLMPVVHPVGDVIEHTAAKQFYVSPFISLDGEYRFRLKPPDDRLSIAIRQAAPDGQSLHAVLSGHAAPFADRTLLRALFGYPLMTVKVIAAIHWEALRLWIKGAPFSPPPLPGPSRVTVAAGFTPGGTSPNVRGDVQND